MQLVEDLCDIYCLIIVSPRIIPNAKHSRYPLINSVLQKSSVPKLSIDIHFEMSLKIPLEKISITEKVEGRYLIELTQHRRSLESLA